MSKGSRCNCRVASTFVVVAVVMAISLLSPERSIDGYGANPNTILGDPACEERKRTASLSPTPKHTTPSYAYHHPPTHASAPTHPVQLVC